MLALGTTQAPGTPQPSGGEAVRPHVRSRLDGVPALLDAVLGTAVRVDAWSDAVDLALSAPWAVVVTAGGDRFGPSGWRIGGAGGGATAAALEEAQERATDEWTRRTVMAALVRSGSSMAKAAPEMSALD